MSPTALEVCLPARDSVSHANASAQPDYGKEIVTTNIHEPGVVLYSLVFHRLRSQYSQYSQYSKNEMPSVVGAGEHNSDDFYKMIQPLAPMSLTGILWYQVIPPALCHCATF